MPFIHFYLAEIVNSKYCVPVSSSSSPFSKGKRYLSMYSLRSGNKCSGIVSLGIQFLNSRIISQKCFISKSIELDLILLI